METPIDLILKERLRQREKEGWSPEHDDTHTDSCLSVAAASYVLDCASIQTDRSGNESWAKTYKACSREMWPFDEEYFKPTPDDPIRQLTKAGALIVAEMERLQRLELK